MTHIPTTPPFATFLHVALRSAGLTQAALHRRTGIGQNRISDYATGKVTPSWETGCLLLRACGCVVDVSVADKSGTCTLALDIINMLRAARDFIELDAVVLVNEEEE